MKRRFVSIIVLLLLVMALVESVMAAPPEAPAFQLSVLAADSAASISDIVDGHANTEFVAVAGDQLAGDPRQSRWVRLQLDADWRAESPPLLSIADAGFTRVWLYAPLDYREQLLWRANVDDQARFSARTLVFLLPADWQASQPLYARIEQKSTSVPLRFSVTDMASYQAADLRHVRVITLFATVQFTMVLVGLCLLLALRDRVFFWFVAYASVQLLYVLSVSGELYVLPGAQWLALFGRSVSWTAASVSAALSISFILEFCDLRRVTPRLAFILAGLRWPLYVLTGLLLLPLSGVDELLSTTLTVINLLVLIASLVAITAVSVASWRGNRASRYFLVAWMPQVAFTAFRVSQLLLGAAQPGWLEYGFPFTMAFASIVVTLGLADATLNARRERDVAHRAAERDGLTGALNRRALTQRLGAAIVHAQTEAQPLALLFMDLDHFKSINDLHGHQAGDHCLQAVAEAGKIWAGDKYTFGRYGGEEFLAILPATTHAAALAAGEQLRRQIELLRIECSGMAAPLRVTASLGIASMLGERDTAQQLIDRADHALYRAKATGRNCVHAHIPLAVAGT